MADDQELSPPKRGRSARVPRDLFKATGVSGLTRYAVGGGAKPNSASGYIYEEWEKKLSGIKGTKTYREMRDSDPIIGGLLFAIEMLIRQVDWHIKPANDTTEAAQIGQFVDTCFHDMETSWPDTVSDIISFLTYGWSLHELLYKRRRGLATDDPIAHSKHDDGLIGWRAFAVRGQETLFRWEYEDEDILAGMTQLGPPDYQFHTVPLKKAMLFRTQTYKGNPEGRSILRSAFPSYEAVKHIKQMEGIGLERDVAGIPFAQVPINVMLAATPEDAKVLQDITKIVTNLRNDEQAGIVWPLAYDADGNETFKFSLLSTSGSRLFDTTKIIERYDARIAMTVLADFILLGHEQTGTYALGASKLGIFSLAVSAWLDTIASQINDVAIPQLCGLNGWDHTLAPRLEHDDIEKADLAGLATYVQTLSTVGALPKDSTIIRYLLEAAEIPVPDAATLKAHIEQQQQAAVEAATSKAGATPAGNTKKAAATQKAQARPAKGKAANVS